MMSGVLMLGVQRRALYLTDCKSLLLVEHMVALTDIL
jgi:hypothetical protein